MRTLSILILAVLLAIPVMAKPKSEPKATSTAQLQAQIRKLTEERDDFKGRLAATETIQQDLAAANKSKDLALAKADALQKELDQVRASMNENQSGAETLLRDLRQAKVDLASCQAENDALKKAAEAVQPKGPGQVMEGALVNLTPDVFPARPINLLRLAPRRENVSRGVVVVNVLVSEKGEVLATRLIQGLPGNDEWVQKANASCVEAARRLVFDPARAADGKTPVKVWQGVGIYLD